MAINRVMVIPVIAFFSKFGSSELCLSFLCLVFDILSFCSSYVVISSRQRCSNLSLKKLE